MDSIRRIFQIRPVVLYVLLLIAMYGLTAGLSSSVNGTTVNTFFPTAIFCMTLGWVIAFGSWKGRSAWMVILFAGLAFIFIRIANLAGPIQDLLKSLPVIWVQTIQWAVNDTPPDFHVTEEALQKIAGRAGILINNIGVWSRMAFQGKIPESPSAVRFLWQMPVLVTASWAGWMLKRRQQVIHALAPGIILSAYLLDYTGQDASALQIELFALLLMMGVTGIEKRWGSSQPNINLQKIAAGAAPALILLSLFLTLIAGFVPSVSIHEITDNINTISQEARDNSFAEALGLQARPEIKGYAPPGLPRQHLVGLDPVLSQNIVFTVETGELPPLTEERMESPAPRHYWRSVMYDVYTGQGWATSHIESRDYSSGQAIFEEIPAGYRVIHMKVEKSPAVRNQLFWTGILQAVDQPYQIAWRTEPESQTLDSASIANADILGGIVRRETYRAVSLLPTFTDEQLRSSPMIYPLWVRERYLTLPDRVPARVITLAESLGEGTNNPYDRARMLEAYLRTFPYSLDVPANSSKQDVADYFLFDLQRGYCDYYATAMVVMARAVGLPARLVTGYANGTYAASEAKYVVRQADAHSWVEIYFTGLGWIEFEPTASQPQIDLPAQVIPIPLNARPFTPMSLNSSTGMEPAALNPWIHLLVATILIGLILAAWMVYVVADIKRSEGIIQQIYRGVFRNGKRLIKRSSVHETPSSFAARLDARFGEIRYTGIIERMLAPVQRELSILTALYVRAVYSPRKLTKDEERLASTIWRRLYWRLLLARFIGGYW